MTSLPIRAFVSATRPRRGRSITQWAAPHRGKRPPNMRLKLAGALVLKETVGSCPGGHGTDRKSTRLNSSHRCISYAVFCLKKKKHTKKERHSHKLHNNK